MACVWGDRERTLTMNEDMEQRQKHSKERGCVTQTRRIQTYDEVNSLGVVQAICSRRRRCAGTNIRHYWSAHVVCFLDGYGVSGHDAERDQTFVSKRQVELLLHSN